MCAFQRQLRESGFLPDENQSEASESDKNIQENKMAFVERILRCYHACVGSSNLITAIFCIFSDTINSISGTACVPPCLPPPFHKPVLLETITLTLKVLLTLI